MNTNERVEAGGMSTQTRRPDRSYLHSGYVQSVLGGTKGYFGSCPSCGCTSFPIRATREEVEADLRDHRERWATT